ncbi:MAG: Ig-like domain-containing protein, partial [Bacteroidota bacterium]|nr:Ig-like domain-containing protein [Bacteroidota bacterium]
MTFRTPISILIKGVLLLTLLSLWQSCAIQSIPEGGDKDVVPPKIVSEAPATKTTNFNDHEIVIAFDEYVSLGSIKDIVMSPRPLTLPKFSAKKRSVVIDFTDVALEENTTYTIFFGNAIKDLNEGNVFAGYRYVFSTGNTLDSMKLSGEVRYALSLNPVPGAKVLLYAPQDTAATKERPVYYAVSGDDGSFRLENLRAGEYQVLAVTDKNENYRWDAGESVGLQQGVRADTANSAAGRIYIYPTVIDTVDIQSVAVDSGTVRLKFTGPIEGLRINNKGFNYFYFLGLLKDTAEIWLDNTRAETINISVTNASGVLDTFVTVPPHPVAAGKLTFMAGANTRTINQIATPLYFEFSFPVKQVNGKLLKITADGKLIVVSSMRFTDSSHKNLALYGKFEDGVEHSVVALPGAFRSIHDAANDTVKFTFTPMERRKYGYLSVNVIGDTSGKAWIFQLVTEKG